MCISLQGKEYNLRKLEGTICSVVAVPKVAVVVVVDLIVCMTIGQYPQINDDLVNSHHLLLCCLDMLYCAAYTKRRELLQTKCPVYQDDLDQQEELSILPQICQSYNG